MLNRKEAERIYKIAKDEILKNGESNVKTITLMKDILDENGLDFSDFFYSENGKLFINLKRWKRKFLEDK